MPAIYRLLKKNAEDIRRRLNESASKRIYNFSMPNLAALLLFNEKPFIAVEDSAESALALYNDFCFFKDVLEAAGENQKSADKGILSLLTSTRSPQPVVYFPPSSAHGSAGERASALFKFKTGVAGSIITSKDACSMGFAVSGIESAAFSIAKGGELERNKLEEWLISSGYRSASVVAEKGEYSRREWIFDIYPSTEELPVRIEFFGDEIDLIREFDIETQRSVREVGEIVFYPACEAGNGNNLTDDLTGLSQMDIFANSNAAGGFELEEKHADYIVFSHMPFVGEGIDAMETSIKGMGILPEERRGIEDLPPALSNINKQTVAVLPSGAQAERLKEILLGGDVIAPFIERSRLHSYDGNLCITTGRLSSGVNLPGLLVLTDREIFGERPLHRPIKKSKVSRLLLSIDDFKLGDFVVHKDRGIGKFLGLHRQKAGDYEEDLIGIEYANGRLYLPFHGIEKLQKYSGGKGHIPSLDKLGGKSWERTKRKVKAGIKEMAEKLLKLYAERKTARGFVFSDDTPLHREFDDFFPYDETPDQIKAVEEIKSRMHSETPMDMLVCGDVGYGKTEVAMKAAFRAVFDGKQVAVLVPTTLLAEQHFRTFAARFSAFPVKIDYLSRFKDRASAKKTIKSISAGEVDIVIGTHMILDKKVQFHDLGLLIIDEEHRFGVAQKERLKELKKGTDVLTLTATPIPRTLQMSLSGIRELVTIETPPEERLAVRSVVTTFNPAVIKEAIEREMKRGGQVFFVHNRISDIEKVSAYIKRLAPEARVAAAHGRMREVDLEGIMLDFLYGKINILVCTAIIGSGLDITTANTIIVDRADTFGLADLYQLKGRVGRGNAQAFAYFLMPGENIITEESKKRLQAIQEMSYLGAGFRLALKDLEIRGAGNLMGAEQSGYIRGVGFDMYMDMMEKAVAELKGEEIKEEVEPQISLSLSAFIPEDYISNITLRLNIYKRISSTKSPEALSELSDELRDRFGSIPEEVASLVKIMRIKLLSKKLHITRIAEKNGRYKLYFLLDDRDENKIEEDFFDGLLKSLFALSSKKIRFFPDGFELDAQGMPAWEALNEVETVLSYLTGKDI